MIRRMGTLVVAVARRVATRRASDAVVITIIGGSSAGSHQARLIARRSCAPQVRIIMTSGARQLARTCGRKWRRSYVLLVSNHRSPRLTVAHVHHDVQGRVEAEVEHCIERLAENGEKLSRHCKRARRSIPEPARDLRLLLGLAIAGGDTKAGDENADVAANDETQERDHPLVLLVLGLVPFDHAGELREGRVERRPVTSRRVAAEASSGSRAIT